MAGLHGSMYPFCCVFGSGVMVGRKRLVNALSYICLTYSDCDVMGERHRRAVGATTENRSTRVPLWALLGRAPVVLEAPSIVYVHNLL